MGKVSPVHKWLVWVPVNDYTPFLLKKDRKEAGLDLRQPLHLLKELQHRPVGKEQLFSATKRSLFGTEIEDLKSINAGHYNKLLFIELVYFLSGITDFDI